MDREIDETALMGLSLSQKTHQIGKKGTLSLGPEGSDEEVPLPVPGKPLYRNRRVQVFEKGDRQVQVGRPLQGGVLPRSVEPFKIAST